MHPIIEAARTWVMAATWGGLAWFLVRMTLIAAAGIVAPALAPRAPAGYRHLTAVLALAGLLALPAATALLPAWRLPILPARAEVQPLFSGPIPTATQGAIAVTAPLAPPAHFLGARDGARDGAMLRPYRVAAVPAGIAPAHRAPAGSYLPALTPVRAAATSHPMSLPAATVALILAVAACLLIRVAFSQVVAWWIGHRAQEVEDESSWRELDLAREQLEIGSAVGLRMTPLVAVPVVSGLVRPVLLLPPEAREWSVERVRAVFLHELAHVRRRDAWWLLLARVSSALCWFHPLVWVLARDARRECERACDDVVLGSGVRASEYAEHLLCIARAAAGRERYAGATLAFARPSSLERRVLSILRTDARRGPASRRSVAAAAAAAMLLLLPLASIQVTAASVLPVVAPAAPAAPAVEPVTALTAPGPALAFFETQRAQPARGTTPSVSAADEIVTASWGPRGKFQRPRREPLESKSGVQWWSEGRENYDAHRYDESAEAYRNAARSGFREGTALYNAACSDALGGRTGMALGDLRDALDAGFDRPSLLQTDSDLNSIRTDRRFQLLVARSLDTDEAKDTRKSVKSEFQELKASRPVDGPSWRSTGVRLMRSGDFDSAIEAFQEGIRLDSSPSTIYDLACAYSLKGERGKALDALERSILAGMGGGKDVQEDADLYPLHGDRRFDQLVQLADDLGLYGNGRGENGLDDEDRSAWRRALPRFERVARDHATAGRAWFNLGYAQLRAGQAESGLASFTRAKDLGYRPPTCLYNMACCSAQAGNRDAAFEWLERAEAAGMQLEDHVMGDRDLDPLRSDARFDRLAERLSHKLAEAKSRGWKDK